MPAIDIIEEGNDLIVIIDLLVFANKDITSELQAMTCT